MYSEYSPCPPLSPYIDKYWVFKGNPGYDTHIHILPDGCTDFIFTLGDVANVADNNFVMQPYRAYFVGPMNKYSDLITYTGSIHMLGIRFLPCGIFRFMHLPLAEFTNQRINAENLNTLFNNSFTGRLCEQTELISQIRLIENILLHSLGHHPNLTDPTINYAVNEINRRQGQLSISSLTENICLCQRHFERKFKQLTGYTPKAYSRIIKFQHTIKLLNHADSSNLLSIATDAGYYDAAHLAKEIKTLSGKPASAFLNRNLPEELTLTYV